jgi:hypothetical protein
MEMVNLTPHSLTLKDDESVTSIPPSGQVARVGSTPGGEIEIIDLPCQAFQAPTWGQVEGLPPPKEGVVYIVSSLVAGHCKGRGDVFSPGTGPKDGAVRNEHGHIVAVTRLIQAPQE